MACPKLQRSDQRGTQFSQRRKEVGGTQQVLGQAHSKNKGNTAKACFTEIAWFAFKETTSLFQRLRDKKKNTSTPQCRPSRDEPTLPPPTSPRPTTSPHPPPLSVKAQWDPGLPRPWLRTVRSPRCRQCST